LTGTAVSVINMIFASPSCTMIRLLRALQIQH
jgi:hypothetical protein